MEENGEKITHWNYYYDMYQVYNDAIHSHLNKYLRFIHTAHVFHYQEFSF